MASQAGLTIIKSFTYDGHAEEWSNQYWFKGTVPANPTAWRALFDAIVLKEKACFDTNTMVVRGYGYDSDADNASAIWTVDLQVSPETPVHGTLATADSTHPQAPGDAANWIRHKTSRLNTKGKAIYLRKYLHGVHTNGASSGDFPYATQKTNLTALATLLDDGTLPGTLTISARKHSDTILSRGVNTYITTRTLKRRGKRP